MSKEFTKEAKKLGWSKTTGIRQLGIILDNLGPCQIAYTVLTNIENFIKTNVCINPVIFFIDAMPPCIHSSAAKFNLMNISTFRGDLIATSIESVLSLKQAVLAKKYYYISDIQNLLTPISQLDDILKDDKIVKFTRSKDYHKELTKFGYKIHSKIIEDFDILTVLEILNGSKS